MQYRLITTRKGLIPITEIKEGEDILCGGKWKKAPKPIKTECVKCYFDTLPATIFAKEDIYHKRIVSANHQPILNEFEKSNIGLSVRGYLNDELERTHATFPFLDVSTLPYWYPRLIQSFGYVYPPTIKKNGFVIYAEHRNKWVELKGNDLAERNLEYYLEGLMRKRLYFEDNFFRLSEVLNETDKLILRLLDIDIIPSHLSTRVVYGVNLLRHIKDDYNKSKLTPQMIEIALKSSVELPPYTCGYTIIKRETVEDWILPNVNADINTLNPQLIYSVDKLYNPSKNVKRKIVEVDSLGKVYKKESIVDKSIFTKLMNS